MVRGKCALYVARRLGPGKCLANVPLFKHIYPSVFTGRQELFYYFKLQLGRIFLGILECLGKAPVHRLNSDSVKFFLTNTISCYTINVKLIFHHPHPPIHRACIFSHYRV